jgi:hypothetical protein
MSFINLPDELIYMICENLKVTDLVSMSVTSKRMNYICKDSNCNNVYELKENSKEEYKKELSNKLINNINQVLNFNKNIKLKLNLSNYYSLRDVSMLGNVHTLNLTGCEGVKDVSMLENVRTLILSHFM